MERTSSIAPDSAAGDEPLGQNRKACEDWPRALPKTPIAVDDLAAIGRQPEARSGNAPLVNWGVTLVVVVAILILVAGATLGRWFGRSSPGLPAAPSVLPDPSSSTPLGRGTPVETSPLGTGTGEVIENSIGMRLVRIPAGEFVMGAVKDDEAQWEAEAGQHRVRITRPFYMGMFEVMQREYETVMGKNPSACRGPGNPVEQVSWIDADDFCHRLSDRDGHAYRLPTEAQWEYACRAGATTPYAFGSVLTGQFANCNGNYPCGTKEKGPYLARTQKVGSYPANAFGLYDMHGNVSEWCEDWFSVDYYANGPTDDPAGPMTGRSRIIRGGSWMHAARTCRSASRIVGTPDSRNATLGFRVVLVATDSGI